MAGKDLTEPRLSPDGTRLAWVRSDQDGARIICITLGATSTETTSPGPVRSGRSLGGGCFDWMPDGRHIVAVSKDGDLRLWNVDGEIERSLVFGSGRAISGPAPDRDGKSIAYVIDQSEIHVVDVSTGLDRRVDEGDFDFVIDPVWWRGRLVWHAWSPPHMPWDESCLVGEDGIVRQSIDTQHQQPQTTLDGRTLGWLDDSSGWLNLEVEEQTRVSELAEHGGPTWGERQRSWCFDSTGERVAFVRNEDGFGRLCTVAFDSGEIVERAKAVHGQLSWRGDVLAAIRTGGRTPTQIVAYDTSGDEWRRAVIDVGPAHDWESSDALVEPELLRIVNGDSEILPARLYRSPHRAESQAGGKQARQRLLVWIHGGPTDQWQVTFMPRFAYWIDRGFDVLVPDFRGSTGHGRRYTQALKGRWGELDVDDVETIVRDVQSRFAYEPESTAVMGSSAGGMTALNLVARESVLASAVVTAYPVTDIAGLDEVTHRFEAHYNRTLIGTPHETRQISAERSPLAHVESLLRIPIIIFHGTADDVVPIEHSRRLVESIRRYGGAVEYVEFDGEGHGFRKLEHKIEEFTRTEIFLAQHLTW